MQARPNSEWQGSEKTKKIEALESVSYRRGRCLRFPTTSNDRRGRERSRQQKTLRTKSGVAFKTTTGFSLGWTVLLSEGRKG